MTYIRYFKPSKELAKYPYQSYIHGNATVVFLNGCLEDHPEL